MDDGAAKLKYITYRHYPFYSDLVIGLDYVITNLLIGPMATDGKRIIIDSDALKKFQFKELLFCHLHELKHLGLLHIALARKYSEKDQLILNIASDVLINELTAEEVSVGDEFKKCLAFKEQFKELKELDVRKLSTLEIYELIFKRFNEILKKIKLSTEGDTPRGGSIFDGLAKKFEEFKDFSKELDKQKDASVFEKEILKRAFMDYLMKKEFDKLPEKEKREIEEKIKDAIMNGHQRLKQRGECLVGMDAYIEHLFKKTRDWKIILKREIMETIKSDYTWTKVSDILQSLHSAGFNQIGNLPTLDDIHRIPNFKIGIDVSGSIDNDEYKIFLDEVYSLFRSVNIQNYELVLWEGDVTKHFTGKAGCVGKALEFLKERKGYGGTTLRSFLDYCKKNMRQKYLSVILTDGYFEDGLKQKDFNLFKKTIFVLSKDCDFEKVNKLKSKNILVLRIN